MLERLRKQLLKLDCIKRAVTDYRRRLKKERHTKRWATLMCSGEKVRNLNPEKRDPGDTLRIVFDNGLYVDYLDGRMVRQRGVTPNFIRPFGMWKW